MNKKFLYPNIRKTMKDKIWPYPIKSVRTLFVLPLEGSLSRYILFDLTTPGFEGKIAWVPILLRAYLSSRNKYLFSGKPLFNRIFAGPSDFLYVFYARLFTRIGQHVYNKHNL